MGGSKQIIEGPEQLEAEFDTWRKNIAALTGAKLVLTYRRKAKKIDPDDGKPYTFDEFEKYYSSHYSNEWIQKRWDKCTPMEQAFRKSGADSAVVASLLIDIVDDMAELIERIFNGVGKDKPYPNESRARIRAPTGRWLIEHLF